MADDPKLVAQIATLYAKGRSQRQVGEALEISQERVSRIMRRNAIPTRRHTTPARVLELVPPPAEPEPVAPALADDEDGGALDVARAAATGDRYTLLVALRDRLARTIADEDTPPRDLAALSRRLMELVKDIDAAKPERGEPEDHGGDVDEDAFDAAAI